MLCKPGSWASSKALIPSSTGGAGPLGPPSRQQSRQALHRSRKCRGSQQRRLWGNLCSPLPLLKARSEDSCQPGRWPQLRGWAAPTQVPALQPRLCQTEIYGFLRRKPIQSRFFSLSSSHDERPRISDARKAERSIRRQTPGQDALWDSCSWGP